MKKNVPVNHHYVPQFILRNFSEDKKKINVYNNITGELSVNKIRTQYSKDNLYKNPSLENIMYVEEAFSKLECDASIIIKQINTCKNRVTLTRSQLYTIKKFFFLMSFRREARMKQYRDSKFDSLTRLTLAPQTKNNDYMDLWLRELKYLLDHDITEYEVCDDLSLPIFLDFQNTFAFNYIVIWEAYHKEEFIVTDSYGTFERSTGGVFPGANIISFYPISNKKLIGFVTKAFESKKTHHMHKSKFPTEYFPFPKNKRIVPNHTSLKDEYVYSICKLTDKAVRYTNELLLNEVSEKNTFADISSIRRSLTEYQEELNKKNDYSMLLNQID